MTRVNRFVSKSCACGGHVSARIGGSDEEAEKCIGQIEKAWKMMHTSPECKPATTDQASAARRKKEKEATSGS